MVNDSPRSIRLASPSKRFLSIALLLCLLAPASLLAAQSPAAPPPAAVERKPHLEGDRITLPLVLVKGYPFVEGEINGVKGKLLFDTGEELALSINDHRVSAPNGVVLHRGHFGSGQTFDVSRYPVIADLKLPGGLEYRDSTNIKGNTGQELEDHITQDFIGWIGLDLFTGYVMKLDYSKPNVTFIKMGTDGAGMKAALQGEDVVQVVHLDFKRYRSIPLCKARIGSAEYTGTFDTGSHSSVFMNAAIVAQWHKDGTLSKPVDDVSTLTGLKIGDFTLEPSPFQVTEGATPVAKEIESTDGNFVVLGYEFLSRYKTVWNFEDHTLTILKP